MSTKRDLLFLSMEDVLNCGGADMKQATVDIQRGFELFVEGKVLQPHKTTLKVQGKGVEQGTGLVNFLPAYVDFDGSEIYSCKSLGAMPSNVELGIPRATGVITLFDAQTKTPICVMDAQVISATRTGAVSSLAARKFAKLSTEKVGLIGAGVNMRTQLLGLKIALPHLKEVYVHSRGQTKHEFAKEMAAVTDLKITPVDTPQEATKNMEMLVTCLPNVSQPVVKAEYVIEKGVTVFNIGCYECEDILLKRMDRVVADIWEQGKHRGVQSHAVAVRNGVISEDKIEDLAPVLTNQKVGRVSDDENIFFCPTGLGFEDAVIAMRVYKQAVERQIGTKVDLWKSTKWI